MQRGGGTARLAPAGGRGPRSLSTTEGISGEQCRRTFHLQIAPDPWPYAGPEWYGWKVFSQSDEDGIISEIFRRIGTTNKMFVEFGAEAGSENNTRLLLETGWTGLWIEGRPEYSDIIRANFQVRISSGELTFVERYVDGDNINELIKSAGISGEIDLLSIDIDSIDYYVFEAIDVIRPRVLCLEHNHTYPTPADWVMQYDTSYRWDPNPVAPSMVLRWSP